MLEVEPVTLSDRRIGRPRTTFAVAVLVLVLGACANGHMTQAPSDEVEAGPPDSVDLQFDAPLGAEGKMVDNPNLAGLPFVVIAPKIGAGHTSFVSESEKVPQSAMAALVYEDATWGRIIVYEHVDTTSQEGLLAWEQTLVERSCVAQPEEGASAVSCSYDPFTQVDIGKGYVALLGTSPKVQEPALTTIEWVEGLRTTDTGADLGPEYHLVIGVQGYANTFSPEEAVLFAQEMVQRAN